MRRTALLLALLACGKPEKDVIPSAARSAESSNLHAAPAETANATMTPVPSEAETQRMAATVVESKSAAELKDILDKLAHGASTGDVFLNHPGVQAVESRRTSDGSVEVHDDWMDVTLVQAGRARIRAGGTVSGSSLRSPGEHRGGAIAGGTARQLGAGDFLLVPAGTPHQFLVSPGDSIRYLTIKVPRHRS